MIILMTSECIIKLGIMILKQKHNALVKSKLPSQFFCYKNIKISFTTVLSVIS